MQGKTVSNGYMAHLSLWNKTTVLHLLYRNANLHKKQQHIRPIHHIYILQLVCVKTICWLGYNS